MPARNLHRASLPGVVAALCLSACGGGAEPAVTGGESIGFDAVCGKTPLRWEAVALANHGDREARLESVALVDASPEVELVRSRAWFGSRNESAVGDARLPAAGARLPPTGRNPRKVLHVVVQLRFPCTRRTGHGGVELDGVEVVLRDRDERLELRGGGTADISIDYR